MLTVYWWCDIASYSSDGFLKLVCFAEISHSKQGGIMFAKQAAFDENRRLTDSHNQRRECVLWYWNFISCWGAMWKHFKCVNKLISVWSEIIGQWSSSCWLCGFDHRGVKECLHVCGTSGFILYFLALIINMLLIMQIQSLRFYTAWCVFHHTLAYLSSLFLIYFNAALP